MQTGSEGPDFADFEQNFDISKFFLNVNFGASKNSFYFLF